MLKIKYQSYRNINDYEIGLELIDLGLTTIKIDRKLLKKIKGKHIFVRFQFVITELMF